VSWCDHGFGKGIRDLQVKHNLMGLFEDGKARCYSLRPASGLKYFLGWSATASDVKLLGKFVSWVYTGFIG